MNKAERAQFDLEPAWVEFVRCAGSDIALLILGVALLAAEVWLLAIGTSAFVVAAIMTSTALSMYMIGRALWEDWRP